MVGGWVSGWSQPGQAVLPGLRVRKQLTLWRHGAQHTSTGPVWPLSTLRSNQSRGCRMPDPCSQPRGAHTTPTPAGRHHCCHEVCQPRVPPGIAKDAPAPTDAPSYRHPTVPAPAPPPTPAKNTHRSSAPAAGLDDVPTYRCRHFGSFSFRRGKRSEPSGTPTHAPTHRAMATPCPLPGALRDLRVPPLCSEPAAGRHREAAQARSGAGVRPTAQRTPPLPPPLGAHPPTRRGGEGRGGEGRAELPEASPEVTPSPGGFHKGRVTGLRHAHHLLGQGGLGWPSTKRPPQPDTRPGASPATQQS